MGIWLCGLSNHRRPRLRFGVRRPRGIGAHAVDVRVGGRRRFASGLYVERPLRQRLSGAYSLARFAAPVAQPAARARHRRGHPPLWRGDVRLAGPACAGVSADDPYRRLAAAPGGGPAGRDRPLAGRDRLDRPSRPAGARRSDILRAIPGGSPVMTAA